MNLKSILLLTGKVLALVVPLLISAPVNAMNKAELVDAIAKDAGLSKADAGNALNAFISNTTSVLKKGDKVQLIGFGSFSISKRAARTGRNPQTGATIQIKSKYDNSAKGRITFTDDGRAEFFVVVDRGYLRTHERIYLVPEVGDEVLVKLGMPVEFIFETPPGTPLIYSRYQLLEFDMPAAPLFESSGLEGENPLYNGAAALLNYLPTVHPGIHHNLLSSGDLEETASALGYCNDAFVDLEAVETALPYGHVTVLKSMADDTGLSNDQLEQFFTSILRLKKGADDNRNNGLGKRRVLTGFGSFTLSKRAARTSINPLTGEKVEIKAKKVAKFKAGAALSSTVN